MCENSFQSDTVKRWYFWYSLTHERANMSKCHFDSCLSSAQRKTAWQYVIKSILTDYIVSESRWQTWSTSSQQRKSYRIALESFECITYYRVSAVIWCTLLKQNNKQNGWINKNCFVDGLNIANMTHANGSAFDNNDMNRFGF